MFIRRYSSSKSRAGLANHLRSMPHPEFILLLQDIYLSLLNGVEGLQEQGRVILDILASVDSLVLPQRLLIRVLIFLIISDLINPMTPHYRYRTNCRISFRLLQSCQIPKRPK